MSHRRIRHALKTFCVVYAAYAAYKAYSLWNKKSTPRNRKRTQQVEHANETDSSGENKHEATLVNANYTTQYISKSRSIKRRRIESIATSRNFLESIVPKFSEYQFKKYFRVSRKTMEKVHVLFESSSEYQNIYKLNGKTKIPAKHYVMIFLWFVGQRNSFFLISKLFNISLPCAIGIIDTVLQFVNNNAGNYICIPADAYEKRICTDGFQEASTFPNVIGGLVSTTIHVQPHFKPHIQAICDSRGRFLNVFFNFKKNVNPTHVLEKVSSINGKLEELCNGEYHILGSIEYHPREWLLTPFKECFTSAEKLYNQEHSKALGTVSDSLKLLKKRFQQLTSKNLFSHNRSHQLITACCVLQNICLREGDLFDAEMYPLGIVVDDEVTQVLKSPSDDPDLCKKGELKRQQIVEAMMCH